MLRSVSVAFLVGLVCGAEVSSFPLSIFFLLIAIAVGLTLFERSGHLDTRSAIVLYVSVLAGVLYWSGNTLLTQSHHPSSVLDTNSQATFVGRVVAPVQHGVERQTIIFQTEEGNAQPIRLRVVWRNPGFTLHHGDHIAFHGRSHAPRGGLNPGGFNYATYLEHQGIDRVATVVGSNAVTLLEAGALSGRWSFWNRIDRWRSRIREAAVHSLSQPALGLFLGMIIGERGYISQEIQDQFMVTGTVHLLSISGSHLGLVSAIGYWVAKRTLLLLPMSLLLTMTRRITPSRLAILCTWPAVALYAVLAGAELATIRSLTMITLAMVAVWLGHDRHLGHAIAAAVLGIVLHDPHAIFDISFQLSFLSVLVMVAMMSITRTWDDAHTGPDGDATRRILLSGLKALSTGAALTLTTLPLVAFYFNQVPWVGMVTNLIAIPFTGLILVPFGLLIAVWSILTDADSLAVGSGLEHVFGWLIEGVQWSAGIPGVEWPIAAPSILTMVLFYIGVLVASLQILSRPWRLTGAGAALVLISWWLIIPGPHGDGDQWRVTFLDVGQGDSAAIELPDGHTVLIDGGARHDRFDMGRSVVAPFLWNRGIHRIDHVIGTHQQLDHVGGLIWILRHMSVGQFWDQGIERPETFVDELRAALRLRGIPARSAVRGQDVLNSGPCHLHVLNPQVDTAPRASVPSLTGTVLNNHSIVLRFECGSHSILFSADIETAGLRQLPPSGRNSVTVLKVPHHGARSSMDQEWLREVHPQYAVVSVGATNPYGHPAESVLKTYEEHDIAVYRTDLDGAVWVTGRLSTSELSVHRMRDLSLLPVDVFKCPWRCEHENWKRLFLQFD